MRQMLEVRACAKINLSLEVLGKRADGFHDLVSVMQTVSLTDRIAIGEGDDIRLACADEQLQSPDNLVLRAARMLRQHYAVFAGCRLVLDKAIPAAAGLGGGSSDGAATLTALARFWQLDLTCAELLPLAAALGSDVTFFLNGGAALVEGRGDVVTALPPSPAVWYLLVKPPIEVSTAAIFSALPTEAWTDGAATRRLAEEMRSGDVPRFGINGLQDTLFRLFPEAATCFHAVQALAPGETIVTGSGPTVVARFPARELADAARQRLSRRGYWMEVVHPCNDRGWQTPCA